MALLLSSVHNLIDILSRSFDQYTGCLVQGVSVVRVGLERNTMIALASAFDQVRVDYLTRCYSLVFLGVVGSEACSASEKYAL